MVRASRILDALAISSLDETAQIQRIAALWCRTIESRLPSSRMELLRWIKDEFGPIIDKNHRDRFSFQALDEVKRQVRLRARRKKIQECTDPLVGPRDIKTRISRLLDSRLGPASHWVRRHYISGEGHRRGYINGGIHSGLIAGLIPVQMKLRRLINPCLLVYRQRGHEPRCFWVPGHILTVAEAFLWVIPQEVSEFLKIPDTWLQHDGEEQAVRLHTPFGSKLVPWRRLN